MTAANVAANNVTASQQWACESLYKLGGIILVVLAA